MFHKELESQILARLLWSAMQVVSDLGQSTDLHSIMPRFPEPYRDDLLSSNELTRLLAYPSPCPSRDTEAP
jgi:hypothetical protein